MDLVHKTEEGVVVRPFLYADDNLTPLPSLTQDNSN
jgi:hypothetical protein